MYNLRYRFSVLPVLYVLLLFVLVLCCSYYLCVSLEIHSCVSPLTTYVLGYSVSDLHMHLVLESSCLSICPILTLTISRFTIKLLGMLLMDSCLKDILFWQCFSRTCMITALNSNTYNILLLY